MYSSSLLWLLAAACPAVAQQIQFSAGENNLKLADQSVAPNILVASNEQVGVTRAAQDLAWDFGRVVGVSIWYRTWSVLHS